MMRVFQRLTVCALVCFAAASLATPPAAHSQTAVTIAAGAAGWQETPPVDSAGTGSFIGTIGGTSTISYRLSYSGLTTPATVAHIHLGAFGVKGGVVAFLCGGGGKPTCPPAGGTVSGTITAANVMAGPGVARGDLAALIQAIKSDGAYVNVHTTKNPDGEVRGQIFAAK